MKFRTRAKTAYGLLSEVRRLILEEPKRYNQLDTLTIRGTRGNRIYDEYPACGTVGCVAGWTTVLAAKNPARVRDVLTYARKVLGLNSAQEERLFNGFVVPGIRQSREHAAGGAVHIRRFQQEFASQLKRTKIS